MYPLSLSHFPFLASVNSPPHFEQALLRPEGEAEPELGRPEATSGSHRGNDCHDQEGLLGQSQGARED